MKELSHSKGKIFESKVRLLLSELQSSFPDRVEVVEQPKFHLYGGQRGGQTVVPDFDIHIDLFFEKAGYLIECQYRKRSSPEIIGKIRNIKNLSKRNRFIFLYAEKISKATRIALEDDGVLCMSFLDFAIFIAKLRVVLNRLAGTAIDANFEDSVKKIVSGSKGPEQQKWYILEKVEIAKSVSKEKTPGDFGREFDRVIANMMKDQQLFKDKMKKSVLS